MRVNYALFWKYINLSFAYYIYRIQYNAFLDLLFLEKYLYVQISIKHDIIVVLIKPYIN